MNLRFYFVTPYYAADEAPTHAFNLPYITVAEQGIADAWSQITDSHSQYDGYLTYNSEAETLGDVQVKKLPALLIYDVDQQRVLFKLEKSEITRANVSRIAATAWSLTPDPQNEQNYLTEAGNSVSAAALNAVKPCPNWVPGFMCNKYGMRSWDGFGLTDVLVWGLVLVLLFILYKVIT